MPDAWDSIRTMAARINQWAAVIQKWSVKRIGPDNLEDQATEDSGWTRHFADFV